MSVEENKYMIIRRKFFLFPSMIKNSQKVKLIPAINQKRWGSIKRAEDTNFSCAAAKFSTDLVGSFEIYQDFESVRILYNEGSFSNYLTLSSTR